MGWAVTALGIGQVIAGLARGSKGGPQDAVVRGDHYDMTPRRNTFEKTHKLLGYAALLLALVTVFMGLVVADAPRWMVLAVSLWWMALIALFTCLQMQGRCIDTYQDIWGPDIALRRLAGASGATPRPALLSSFKKRKRQHDIHDGAGKGLAATRRGQTLWRRACGARS
jgi:hypothetical protein